MCVCACVCHLMLRACWNKSAPSCMMHKLVCSRCEVHTRARQRVLHPKHCSNSSLGSRGTIGFQRACKQKS